jgi:hypothetical protein
MAINGPVGPEAYAPHKRIPMRGHPTLTEKWVQQRIADNPALLGLGEDVEVKDLERLQPKAGRLDMLLYDAAIGTRYEVELQLGPTDESHIIRTIEYWDLERKRYPQYEHVGVIVAEDITARFFNVIGLFNGAIPLVAVQMQAIEVGNALTLVLTTVLDRAAIALEEGDEPDEPRTRGYWEQKSSKGMLALTDRFLGLVRTVDPSVTLKYNKNYIGLARSGIASNFVSFRPKKNWVNFEAKIPRTDDLNQRLADAGIEQLAYSRWGYYRMPITEADFDEHSDVLAELIGLARESYDS